MNRIPYVILFIMICGVLNGCADNKPTLPNKFEGTSYTGLIPCADCEGIAYRLSLKNDHRFETRSVYIGKSNRPFIERGTWSTSGDSLLILNASDEHARQFKIKNEQLMMLNEEGKEISGSLAKMFILNETDSLSVDTVWKQRRKQGIDFIAAGNDSSWKLNIDFEKKISFKTKGGNSVKTGVPQMKQDSTSNARIWNASAAAGPLKVEIYPIGCVDDTSGQVYSYSVKIMHDSKQYNGCGNFINEIYKLNDFWQLHILDDSTIIDNGPKALAKIPSLQFDVAKKKVFGYTGCNHLSGNIRLKDENIRFSELITTKMACAEGTKMESHFLDALHKTKRYNIVQGELLLLNQKDTLMVLQHTD